MSEGRRVVWNNRRIKIHKASDFQLSTWYLQETQASSSCSPWPHHSCICCSSCCWSWCYWIASPGPPGYCWAGREWRWWCEQWCPHLQTWAPLQQLTPCHQSTQLSSDHTPDCHHHQMIVICSSWRCSWMICSDVWTDHSLLMEDTPRAAILDPTSYSTQEYPGWWILEILVICQLQSIVTGNKTKCDPTLQYSLPELIESFSQHPH